MCRRDNDGAAAAAACGSPAGTISSNIGRHCGRRACGKLQRNVAVEHGRTDMIETALDIGPDFAADIGPALAEREILAEIRPRALVDHAIEQCEPVGTSRERVYGMFAEELQRGVSGMFAHLFQRLTPDHQESSTGVAYAREAVHR